MRFGNRNQILAYYDYSISTGPLEGTNTKMRVLQHQAYGFRDTEFFKLEIYALHETRLVLVGGVVNWSTPNPDEPFFEISYSLNSRNSQTVGPPFASSTCSRTRRTVTGGNSTDDPLPILPSL